MGTITLKNVRKAFGDAVIIPGADLDIGHGEFVVFVGPSGCGKSTLLRLVAGLEDISSGELKIDGQVVNDLPPSERGISMVFQSYALYPHMTVYENMAFGLKLAKTEGSEADRRVREAARILQLDHLLERKPKQLSGGQRQRVAIGRAIVRDPKVFLFDEPLSNLDAALRVQMRIEIAKLHHSMSATMIYVTHDQVEAMTLADRIVVLEAGIVRQFGSPLDLYQHPDNQFVAGFIGSPKMNFLPCEVVHGSNEGTTVRVLGGDAITTTSRANGGASGSGFTVGVRPEHLRADGSGDGQIVGKVVTAEQLGAESWIYLDIGQPDLLVVKAGAGHSAKPDEEFAVGVPAAACYLFDDQGRCFPRQAFN
jgi:multiple sugar transport system ATP-binding protein